MKKRAFIVLCLGLSLLFCSVPRPAEAITLQEVAERVLTLLKRFKIPGGVFKPNTITQKQIQMAKNVIVVSKSGGDFKRISAALSSIGDASASNRYQIWVAPGTYVEEVTMKEYVDIEGSGKNLTIIDSTTPQTVIAASNCELRSLTVSNQGDNVPAFTAVGILAEWVENFVALHVRVDVFAPVGGALGVEDTHPDAAGVVNYASYIQLSDCQITADGDSVGGPTVVYGIYHPNEGSEFDGGDFPDIPSFTSVKNTEVEAAIEEGCGPIAGVGIYMNTGVAFVDHSRILGNVFGALMDGCEDEPEFACPFLGIGASMLDGFCADPWDTCGCSSFEGANIHDSTYDDISTSSAP